MAGPLLACGASEEAPASARATETRSDPSAAIPRNPEKDAFFGDLHIHSAWSLDAFVFRVRVTPEDAYRYVRGGAIDHVSGEQIRMQGPPLDFVAISEHANYMGVPMALLDENDPRRQLPVVKAMMDDDPAKSAPAMSRLLNSFWRGGPFPTLLPGDLRAPAWKRLVDLANRHDVPGTFTAFVAYEYTSMPKGQNLHRNVVFRGSDVPGEPFSSFDSENPEDLWDYMDAARAEGSDLISIPHNSNGSNGLMYQRVDTAGVPLDTAYAEQRLRNEPVSEVMQIKGQSETHPALSPGDEWANFEVLGTILGRPADLSQPAGSYARHAFKTGLELEEERGVNPYRFGVLGSSDGHNASSPVEEDNYTGKLGIVDGTPEVRLGLVQGSPLGPLGLSNPFSAAGLAGIWAPANTREDLFDAMRARETFSTSGPRIRVRLFAGFDLASEDLGDEMVQRGYAKGVPMGGELVGSVPGKAPTLLAHALRDPREAPLERLQVIKGWIEDGSAKEKVFDIACANAERPDPNSHRCAFKAPAPDFSDCSYREEDGSPQLAAAWTDPEFDASQRSFYYVRVLQIPTCRWSSWDAIRLGVPRAKDATHSIQERAITSPIWYRPDASREAASLG
ncbi:MAG: DUF3604 domain-containing protein [Myxococcales bacterium]|nr:DUF3604 domain-containing protein [Myxococcales bacterium]